MIPMVDLHTQYLALKPQIDGALLDVLEKTHFILGENVNSLESELASYLDCKYAISCASGTDALHLALLALGIGPGDEVITTPFTFIATAEAIAYVGATPVFVDIDHVTFNIDVEDAADAITEKTKAIMPVHLFGHACELTRLQELCNQNNLKLVEDCAQSIGGKYGSKYTGTFGDVGCFSFFPSKNLGAFGDGGLITTNSDEIAANLLMYRNHGSRKQYIHQEIGYNSRLDEMQAAILRQKLPYLDEYNAGRRRVADRYFQQLREHSIQLPSEADNVYHVYHQYTMLTDQREEIQSALKEKSIASAIYYPIPLHQQEAMKKYNGRDFDLIISQSISEQCLSLPIYPELPDNDIDRICETIIQVVN